MPHTITAKICSMITAGRGEKRVTRNSTLSKPSPVDKEKVESEDEAGDQELVPPKAQPVVTHTPPVVQPPLLAPVPVPAASNPPTPRPAAQGHSTSRFGRRIKPNPRYRDYVFLFYHVVSG